MRPLVADDVDVDAEAGGSGCCPLQLFTIYLFIYFLRTSSSGHTSDAAWSESSFYGRERAESKLMSVEQSAKLASRTSAASAMSNGCQVKTSVAKSGNEQRTHTCWYLVHFADSTDHFADHWVSEQFTTHTHTQRQWPCLVKPCTAAGADDRAEVGLAVGCDLSGRLIQFAHIMNHA